MTNLTNENLNEVLNSEGTVVIKFSAEWCASCKNLAPKYTKMTERFTEEESTGNAVIFANGDIKDSEIATFAKSNGVRALPAVMVMKGKTVIKKYSGIINVAELENELRETI